MNPDPLPLWLRASGVLVALAYVFIFVFFAYKITSNSDPHTALLKIVLIGFIILVSVYTIDIVGATKINLLDEQERLNIFGLIKDITLIVFAFYFGTQTKKIES